MTPSFHTADRQTYRRVAIIGLLFCLALVVISFSLKSGGDDAHAVIKADRLVRMAGEGLPAN